jgi:hypothetical protein
MATPPAFDNTLGASFIALVSACTIYGITILQTYSYFLEYPDDRRFLKCFVRHLPLVFTHAQSHLLPFETQVAFIMHVQISSRKRPRANRCVRLLDTVTMAFLCHSIYWYTVTSFGVYSGMPAAFISLCSRAEDDVGIVLPVPVWQVRLP